MLHLLFSARFPTARVTGTVPWATNTRIQLEYQWDKVGIALVIKNSICVSSSSSAVSRNKIPRCSYHYRLPWDSYWHTGFPSLALETTSPFLPELLTPKHSWLWENLLQITESKTPKERHTAFTCLHHVTLLSLLLSDHKQFYQKFSLCEQAICAAYRARMQVIDLSKLNFHKGLKPVSICVYMLWRLQDLIEAITLPKPQSGSFEQTLKFAFCHLHTYSLIPEQHVNRNVSFMKIWLLGELLGGKQ